MDASAALREEYLIYPQIYGYAHGCLDGSVYLRVPRDLRGEKPFLTTDYTEYTDGCLRASA
jgi:hypothetical protein